jgi:hypothetical protein
VVFLGALVATLLLAGLFGVDLSAGSAWVFVVLLATAAWLFSQPLADAKRSHAFFFTQARYLVELKVLNCLCSERCLARAGFTAVAWRGHPR